MKKKSFFTMYGVKHYYTPPKEDIILIKGIDYEVIDEVKE